MKVVFIYVITVLTLFAENVCVDLNHSISSKTISLYKKLHHLYIPQRFIKEDIENKKKFAQYFLKNHKLTQNEKEILQIALLNELYYLLKQHLRERLHTTPDIIKSFYLDHQKEFANQELVSIYSIKIANAKFADELYNKIKMQPEKFIFFAKKYSLDKNYEYDDVSIDKFSFQVRQWLEKAKPGDISPPIKVGKFYFIDKLIGKKQITTKYDDLKPYIKELLKNIVVNKKLKEIKEEE